ncbi:MAG: ABC transporter substrate-binding protein [Cyclobacteriaceae bacterium]
MKNLNQLSVIVLIATMMSCGGGGGSSEQATQASEVGVTDSTITIGTWGPLTGPAALWGNVPRGVDAYFHYINENGGIHGRKINVVVKDDGFQPSKTVAAVREMVERDEVFAFVGGVGTAPCMAVKDYIIRNDIPWISPVSGATHWAYPPQNNIFTTYSLYFDEAFVQVDHIVNSLGKDKIAIIYQNDDYGKSGLVGVKIALEKYDLELTEEVSTEVTDQDLGSHVARLKESGADVVIMQVLPRQAAIITGTAAVMGFTPQWMTNSTLSDTELMYKITEGKWAGVLYSGFFNVNADVDLEGYQAALKSKYPEVPWTTFVASGYYFGEPVAKALNDVGQELTREKFIQAMEKINDFKGLGLGISFGEGVRQGTRGAAMYRCTEDGQAEQVSNLKMSEMDLDYAIAKLADM